MASPPAKFAWLDGEFVRWEDAKIHIRSECVIRGINVFASRCEFREDVHMRVNVYVGEGGDHTPDP